MKHSAGDSYEEAEVTGAPEKDGWETGTTPKWDLWQEFQVLNVLQSWQEWKEASCQSSSAELLIPCTAASPSRC